MPSSLQRALVVHLRLRLKHRPFIEQLHPRDGAGRFALVPGVDPLLERIRAAATLPTRAPRSQPDFDEEEYGLVFRDGEGERVAKAYKANVVASLGRALRGIPDDMLLEERDFVQLADIQNGDVDAYLDPAVDEVRTTRPGAPPSNPTWTTLSPAAARTAMRSWSVNRMIADWAMTSNDEYFASLALQDIARDHFGLQPTADWTVTDQVAQEVAEHRAARGPALTAFLTSMWESTQNHLREADLGSLTVFRGMSTPDGRPPADWAADGATLDSPPLRPLSSFSLDPVVAEDFATDNGPGIVISAIVPAGRIIATPATGVGCLDEAEVVVLAGPGTWHWQSVE
ncbi:hypothetical protein ACFC58_03310 [Kitasatospora purpeofusca]|uniref:hypothetical protein n=1 Tax=Kitasatospora purpeofusca TaxID=67352 RepID=UPI0035D7544F